MQRAVISERPSGDSLGAPDGYRLRLPGPVAVPERVRAALARPLVNHRGAEFRAVMTRCEELLQPILGTTQRVLFFGCSGTGMMEASLVNTLGAGERALIVVQGQFGERYAAIARALGIEVETLDVPWGQSVDAAAVGQKVKDGRFRAVVTTQNESSTGVVTDLAAIGAVLRGTDTLLLTDAVSALGGIAMRQDEWGVDVVVGASQKALMCPPGLGLVSLSAKARAVVARDDRLPRFYWDFRKSLASTEKAETPFTSPVGIMFGLAEALGMIHAEGIETALARHAAMAAALRAGCAALGLPSYGDRHHASSTVVALEVPDGLDGGAIVRNLYETHRTVIAGSRNRLSGRVIRIGTMGAVAAGDILLDLAEIEQALRTLGRPAPRGAGVAAAMEVLGL